jgi:hypothetical protein
MPTIESLRRLASALDVPTDYLLGLTDISSLVGTDDIAGQDIDPISDNDLQVARKIVRMLMTHSQTVDLPPDESKRVQNRTLRQSTRP